MSRTETSPHRYRIAEAAQLSGFTPSALRYYEEAGVFAAPARTAAGYRLYDDRDLERLQLIARAKDLGCNLQEIAALGKAWDSDECGPVKHQLRALVHSKVTEVEKRLVEQSAFAEQLRTTLDALAARPLDGPCDDLCGCTTTVATEETGPGCTGGCECGTGTPDTVQRPDATGDRRQAAAPVACSLPPTAIDDRLDDWGDLLDDVTTRRVLPAGLRLEFNDRVRVAELASLVANEQRCCSFFAFAITLDYRGVALEVTAPKDGQHILERVFGARH